MAFTNSFTGKGTAVNLPSLEGVRRSEERMGDLIMAAQKLKLDTLKKNEEEFLKSQDVSPVNTISNYAIEYQSGLIDKFNKKWGAIAQKTGMNLSTEQKVEQMKDRRFIESEGQQIQSMQKAWEAEDALVKKDPLNFDDTEHKLKTQEFLKTGKFDYNNVPWKAQPISDDLVKMRGRIGQERDEDFAPDPKYPYLVTRGKVTGTKEEIAPLIRDKVLSDPRTQKHMLQTWSALPQVEKDKYLDVNKDGIVSPEENNNSNPILDWYVDSNYELAIQRKSGEIRDTRKGTGKTSFDWSNVGSGQNRNATFKVYGETPIQTTDGPIKLPDYINMGVPNRSPEVQAIRGRVKINPDGSVVDVPSSPNEAARFEIMGYSPTKDVLTIKMIEDSAPEGEFEKDEVYTVKASDYDDLLKGKPYGISRDAFADKRQQTPTQPKKKAY